MTETPLTIETLQEVLSCLPHCVTLDLRIANIERKKITLEMPYSRQIIGNPDTGVIHGGAITTLLDTTLGFSVQLSLEGFTRLAPPSTYVLIICQQQHLIGRCLPMLKPTVSLAMLYSPAALLIKMISINPSPPVSQPLC